MKKAPPDMSNHAWLEQFMSGTSADTKAPAFRPML
jgi:hypothetical protein